MLLLPAVLIYSSVTHRDALQQKHTNQTPPNHVILTLEPEGIKRFQSKVKENKQAIVFCIRKQPCLDHNPLAKPIRKAWQTSKR